MSFGTAEPALKDVLDGIANGQIQLPDFQRGWVWDDGHIKSLIASLTLSYPIGAVMFLEAGGVPFRPRLFAGVILSPAPSPRTLVLDGQQRLTSMYLALRSGRPVPTRNEKGSEVNRLYFLDMAKCLDVTLDREDAVLSVPESLTVTSNFGRKLILDVSTPDQQYRQRLFPGALLFDMSGFMTWESGFTKYHNFNAEAMQFMQQFRNEIWLRFQQFKVPVIELKQDTPREAVCQVFEKVNTRGVVLTIFELMTAIFAAYNFNLRDDWEHRRKRMTAKHDVLKAVDGTSFLMSVTLLVSYLNNHVNGTPVGCKRGDVLKLSLDEFKQVEAKVERGFMRAAELLAEEKIFDDQSLPYATQLIPLSAICAYMDGRSKNCTNNISVKTKLLRWYWNGVLGEVYGGASENRFAMDIQDVVSWVDGGDEPRTIRDANFSPTRMLSLHGRHAAAYKGLTALLMKHGAKDLVSGTPIDINTYFNNAIDIHHVFPRAWCEKQKLPKEKWNSVINKTPLAASTNKFIGGDAPSKYVVRIQKSKQVPGPTLEVLLKSHAIPVKPLKEDDFDGFLRLRAALLLNLVEDAMGKVVLGRDSQETINVFGGAITR
jgi:hypothetical protein